MRKLLTILLLILFIFAVSAAQDICRAQNLPELQGKIQQLKAESLKLTEESAKYRQAIREKMKEARNLSNTIFVLENQIKVLELSIQKTQNQINQTNLEIRSIEIKIQKTEQDIARKKQRIADILKTLYERKHKSIIEIFLVNEKFSEFLAQKEYLENLNFYLAQGVKQLRDFTQNLKNEKQDKISKKKDLEGLKFQLAAQKSALKQQQNYKARILMKTKGEEAAFKKMLSEVEQKKAQLLKQLKELERQAEIQKNFLVFSQSKKIPPRGTKIFFWPEKNAILTQGYGMTSFARRGAYGGAPHNGIDMTSGAGSSILAAQSGVVLAKGHNKGWGNWIAIKHPTGLVTLYAHMLNPALPAIGQFVQAKQTIGYEDTTGFATGSHLHFSVYYKFFTYIRHGEIYFNYFEGTLNPLDYL